MTRRSELTRQWIVVVRARLDRDWTGDGLSGEGGTTVERDGAAVGQLHLVPVVAEADAEGADRTGTDLVFLDVVDTRPAVGAFLQR